MIGIPQIRSFENSSHHPMDDGIGKLSSSRVYVNRVITRKMECGETLWRKFAPAWNPISGAAPAAFATRQ
jgi:hypothetical protein